MNPNTLAEDQTSTLLNVDAKPISLRLPIGSAIFPYSGEVWITQEGMHEDVIIGPGQRFDVGSRAPILASATRQPATLYLARSNTTEHVDTDVYACLRRRARQLRTEEINAMGKTISDRLSHELARFFVHLSAMFAPSKRVPVSDAPR